SLFYSSPRPHRALHSFPTRRSSDLVLFNAPAASLGSAYPVDVTASSTLDLSNTAANSTTTLGALNRIGGNTFSVVGSGRTLTFADRKSTRLNSSHLGISYAVFCLKK